MLKKPLSQMHRSTFLPLQHAATLIFSVDWGLGSKDQGTKEVGVAKHTVSYTASQRLNHRRTYVPYRLAEGESR